MNDYDRVAQAIDFITARAGDQPGLADVAAAVHLSPHHFQRLFLRWAGISPKRFLQAVTVERAKHLLAHDELSLLDASETLGLSSSSRLYDHFVRLEAVTPGEFRQQGADLTIRYGVADSPFGAAFVAATPRGICSLTFGEGATGPGPVEALRTRWPRAELVADAEAAARMLNRVFDHAASRQEPLSVHVHGTNFQIAVWRALLAIPEGRYAAYTDVARAVGRPRAVRAVGTAVGANPCAFLIPCHRVIRANGDLGGYRWGLVRKQAINVWEAAATDAMLPRCANE